MKPDEYLADKTRKEKKGKKEKDWEDFMTDRSGKALQGYTFNQTLVEGKDGNTYMQMTYKGNAANMIEQLEIPHPLTIPAHISNQFIDKGILQFNRGTYAYDQKIRGFYIPVTIK